MRIILFFSVLVFLTSCSSNTAKVKFNTEFTTQELKTGASLISQNCASCHSAEKSDYAPSWNSIKAAYFKKHPDSSEAMTAMLNFLSAPNQTKPLLANAIETFGEMPLLNYSLEEYRAVTKFIFTQPTHENKALNHALRQYQIKESTNYLQKGKSIAMQTKGVLGRNLKGAIMKNGTDSALQFCNVKALHLTDSMAKSLNAKIKRVSDQPRNPQNLANEAEIAIIKSYKEQLMKGEKLKEITNQENEKLTTYYPILTNKMCMQCHGAPNSEIKPSTMGLINKSYPEDQATGYGLNALRGIWVIDFKKE